jgi:hypothetical protein
LAATDQCLRQVADLRAAAEDPSSAYLIRSRLRRAILSCARLVAHSTGAPKPDVPGVFLAPRGCSEVDSHVVTFCNRIYGIANELCQPSESFDLRWERGWQLLRKELDQLQCLLEARASTPYAPKPS